MRSLDEVTRLLSRDLPDALLSLGATKYEMIKVILRQLMPGLVTAILLAVGRGIGDAATVLFTAGYTDNIPVISQSACRNITSFNILPAWKSGGRSSEPCLCISYNPYSNNTDTELFSTIF